MLKTQFFFDFPQKTWYNVNIVSRKEKRKVRTMKKLSIFFIIFIPLFLCACENHWMKDILQITITFDTNGGTPVPPKQILYKGEKVEKPKEKTFREKNPNIFAEWYIDIYYKQGSNSPTDNQTILDEEKSRRYDFDSVPSLDMTLYAGYKDN
jgi:hypothetical protein